MAVGKKIHEGRSSKNGSKNQKNQKKSQNLRMHIVWQDAIQLYIFSYKVFPRFPFELKKVASNAIDAAHSISRNIAEGYCRRSVKEYLNHLHIALGSCGEFHSCYESFIKAQQISEEDFEKIDQLHYKLENSLLKLIKSIQKKQINKDWEENLCVK